MGEEEEKGVDGGMKGRRAGETLLPLGEKVGEHRGQPVPLRLFTTSQFA